MKISKFVLITIAAAMTMYTTGCFTGRQLVRPTVAAEQKQDIKHLFNKTLDLYVQGDYEQGRNLFNNMTKEYKSELSELTQDECALAGLKIMNAKNCEQDYIQAKEKCPDAYETIKLAHTATKEYLLAMNLLYYFHGEKKVFDVANRGLEIVSDDGMRGKFQYKMGEINLFEIEYAHVIEKGRNKK